MTTIISSAEVEYNILKAFKLIDQNKNLDFSSEIEALSKAYLELDNKERVIDIENINSILDSVHKKVKSDKKTEFKQLSFDFESTEAQDAEEVVFSKPFQEAQEKMDQEKQKKRPFKVRRVNPKDFFDMTDVVNALGIPDLAKEMATPKPLFTVSKDEDGQTIMDRSAVELLEQDRIRKEIAKNPPTELDVMNPCDIEDLASKLEHLEDTEKLDIEALEWRVAIAYKNKLSADRKLKEAEDMLSNALGE